jgi:LmbE family N-acetylglucosaminyl deacetylase
MTPATTAQEGVPPAGGWRPAREVRAALAALPPRDLLGLVGDRPVLVLAPHPDDESLGCGGLIAQACARGHPMHVAILTDGAASHPPSAEWPAARLRHQRALEARAATGLLGLPPENLVFLDVPDGRAPHAGPEFAGLAHQLGDIVRQRGIGTICATWQHDAHPDHVAAGLLAAAVARRTGVRHLAYPIWTWMLPPDASLPAPRHGARLDIGGLLPLKRRAIAAHRSQITRLVGGEAGMVPLSAEFLAQFDRPWETFIAVE